MVNVIDKLRPRRETAAAEPPREAVEDPGLREVPRLLEEHRIALIQSRGTLDQLEADIADLRVARALGEKIDNQRLLEMIEDAERQTVAVREAETVVTGLQARMDAWRALEGRRRYDDTVAELHELAARFPDREARYEALAIELVELVQVMHQDYNRYQTLQSLMASLSEHHGLRVVRPRSPHRAPQLSETFWTLLPTTSRQTVRGFFAKEVRHRFPNWAQPLTAGEAMEARSQAA
ncbi:MAG: hypothetical protein U0Z70_07005 [Thermomicrobiales bacterium]